jgi:hypothetical protein
MPSTDSADPVPTPSPEWKVISEATVARAVSLATKYRTSRRDNADAARELGKLLRDAERGRPGRPPSENRQRLAEYGRLIKACGISRGTAVNFQYLAEIKDPEWAALMRQEKDEGVPSLTRLYALGRTPKKGEGGGSEGSTDAFTFLENIARLLSAKLDRLPEAVEAVRRLLGTVLWIDARYHLGTLDAGTAHGACPRVVRSLVGVAKVMESLDGLARADTSRGKP